jgi:filamin
MGVVDVVILDPHGHRDTTRPTITQKSDGVFLVEYYPTQPGLHSVNVFFAGKAIPNSPFGVGITPGRCCFVALWLLQLKIQILLSLCRTI